MDDIRIAIYIRLSNADEDTGKLKDESNSVVNQRNLIHKYLDKHEELSSYPRVEFIDDGFTGTNTDRPAFQRMISQIRAGKYKVCITKDFSRFARDYIEMGDYIECIFPFLNVRYISINDNYDSNDYKGTTGGLDVVMRSIVYDAYSKDLSAKGKSGRRQNMKKGRRTGGTPGYGYMIDPDNTAMDIIDPEAAKVVRRIFDYAIEGKSIGTIAAILNAEHILTPAQYFRNNKADTVKFKNLSDKSAWTYNSVRDILRRYKYTGAAVGSIMEKTAPCSKKIRQNSRDKWIVVPDMHEAIITVDEYNKAQQIIKKTPFNGRKNLDYPLKSLVVCSNCMRKMRRHEGSERYHCIFRRHNSDTKCKDINTLKESELDEIVFRAIMDYIQYVNTEMEVLNENKNKELFKTDLESANDKLEQLKKLKFTEYQKYVSGKYDKESYMSSKDSIDKQIAELENIINESQTVTDNDDMYSDVIYELDIMCNKFREQEKLTYDMAHSFIDRIIAYPDNRIEIKWRFMDCFKDNMKI